MELIDLELKLQDRYFYNPKSSKTELELSSLLVPKFEEYVHAEEFLGHSEVGMNIQLDDLIAMVGEEDFKEMLFEKPEIVIPSIEYAMHYVALHSASDPSQIMDCRCIVRVQIPKPTSTIKELKASSIGKLICIKGTVIRASSIKPHLVSMVFCCSTCKANKEVTFRDGKYTEPKKCHLCGSSSFIPMRNTVKVTETQRIRIQEVDEGEGRIPRSIEIELVNELVNTCVPGDTVIVSGVLRRNDSITKQFKRKNKSQTIYEPYIAVNYLENCRAETGDRDITEFSEKDMKFIEILKEKNNLLRLLVHSLCPPIYGHYIVKTAIVLVLFGGTRKHDIAKIRADSHLLIVGDPGLGKSQMLRAVANIVPRGVYVSGSSTTKTGLTVALHRYSGTSDFTLESGALVLGDQGVCCIDEFDKMERADYSSLLEAMEQQSISIAKAGICCTLLARTSVIAAANPVEGHFNCGKTVSENINMPSPLLSRFDLIFVLVDNPDAEADKELSNHIIKMHSGKNIQRKYSQLSISQISSTGTTQSTNGRISLRDYLSDHSVESSDPLPPRLFRKYLAYARANIHPQLNEEAKLELQRFYIELRQSYKEDDDTPVTTRQLESLIRLTEARAKAECREIATKDDAMDVIEIFKIASLTGLGGISNSPVIDFRAMGGVRGGKSKMLKSLMRVFQTEAKKKNSNILTKNEIQQIASQLHVPDMQDLVDQLNNEGFLLKQSGGYKLATGM
ncbi:DNA replication licensing factor, putative [Entamoeba histolytica HM-1:IMSS-B]|uniref:DNA helicase n=6 Tax=Entamoeba histolytica TaxID=5759 RepID=C4M3N9_ENTH1|nr:DNA replication licensing factor, putative [Entamoeba histolytica HM-1:IMSS]EMD42951.1 DNA replication licensing factor mcm4, putative [Entamoeba histolytica KU27]EMH76895.1 DNA replication licensing factor, putative [Entamoeba histolytica HM-1:IMSS-B]EMS17506.1 DNA replication licensing factor mcm4, putative [Entamoeba histolytica HM-3:IMSS]ENY61241.1 DNA replication licensing factor mcm4, putative [Entamoeba histolytica HM-1:IMSS-A]GAT95941.1 DNA replication licensing factor putative [Ent|eukprot:XP_654207.1 DNA replication licensing factor, putative [Entamoeba histolytica HM-1:IMSS]